MAVYQSNLGGHGRFNQTLDSDETWTKHFCETGLELQEPDRYIRSHHIFEQPLPELDDKYAFEDNRLDDLAKIYEFK